MANVNSLEKGAEKVDVHEQLAAEVYGVGEVDKFSSWALRLRGMVRKLGAEENGIERIPPEARIDQEPIGMSSRILSDNQIFSISLPAVTAALLPLH